MDKVKFWIEIVLIGLCCILILIKIFLSFSRNSSNEKKERAYFQGFKDGLKGNKDISGNNFDDFGYDYVDGYKEGYKLKGSSYLKIQKQKKQKNHKKKVVLIEHN